MMPTDVKCPKCGAPRGVPCNTGPVSIGRRLEGRSGRSHPARFDAVAQEEIRREVCRERTAVVKKHLASFGFGRSEFRVRTDVCGTTTVREGAAGGNLQYALSSLRSAGLLVVVQGDELVIRLG